MKPETIIQIVGLVILGVASLLAVWKFHTINKYLLRFINSTPIRAPDKEFGQLLKDIKALDIESKIMILQSLLSPTIQLHVEVCDNKLTILGVSNDGLDEEVIKSIG